MVIVFSVVYVMLTPNPGVKPPRNPISQLDHSHLDESRHHSGFPQDYRAPSTSSNLLVCILGSMGIEAFLLFPVAHYLYVTDSGILYLR